MKRNKIYKIATIKKRNTFNPFFSHIADLNETLIFFDELFYKKQITNITPYEYIPVTIVACIQSFLRYKIHELLDFGEPYFSNSKKMTHIKGLKLEIEDLEEIAREKLHRTDIIAHHMPIHNLESLNAVLSTLMETDFLYSLLNFDPPKYKNEKIQLLRQNKEAIFKDIASIFELRNIYCHEFSSLINTDIPTLLRYLTNAIVFIENIDCFLYETLKSRSSSEQLNEKESFEKSEKKLTAVIKSIIAAIDEMGFDSRVIDEELNTEIDLWKKYRKKQAKQLATFYYTPTNQYKQRFWTEMDRLTTEKIISLEHSHSTHLSLLKSYNSIERFS